jgi:hypothetical protein
MGNLKSTTLLAGTMPDCMASTSFYPCSKTIRQELIFVEIDAYSNAKLASVSASSLRAKNRRLELHNPDILLPFEFTGAL